MLSQSAASQSAMSDTHSHGGSTMAGEQLGATPALDEVSTKKVTVQQPFNLTKPKPKKIPQPISIEQHVVANPVPHHIFKKSLAEVEKEKEDRRKAKTEEIKKEYEENPKKRFELNTEQRPTVQKVQAAKDKAEETL